MLYGALTNVLSEVQTISDRQLVSGFQASSLVFGTFSHFCFKFVLLGRRETTRAAQNTGQTPREGNLYLREPCRF